MAIYYVNSAGGNTAPYDTPEKGAPDFWAIRQYAVGQVDTTPTIYVVANNSNDRIVDASPQPWGVVSTIDESFMTSVRILSAPGNLHNPIIDGNSGTHLVGQFQVDTITTIEFDHITFANGVWGIYISAGTNNLTVNRCKFIENCGNAGAQLSIGGTGITGALSVTNNLFDYVGPTGGGKNIQFTSDNNATSGEITNNTFITSQGNRAWQFQGAQTQPNLTVVDNIVEEDFTLQPGSPCIGTGFNGNNIG